MKSRMLFEEFNKEEYQAFFSKYPALEKLLAKNLLSGEHSLNPHVVLHLQDWQIFYSKADLNPLVEIKALIQDQLTTFLKQHQIKLLVEDFSQDHDSTEGFINLYLHQGKKVEEVNLINIKLSELDLLEENEWIAFLIDEQSPFFNPKILSNFTQELLAKKLLSKIKHLDLINHNQISEKINKIIAPEKA